MIIIWRGWGVLAVVPAFIPLVTFAFSIDNYSTVGLMLTGLEAILGGLTCLHLGRKWNGDNRFHTFYELTLQEWGWIYIVSGGLLTELMILVELKLRLFG